jgi:hypothetical protein
MSTADERNVDPIQEIIHIAQNYLELSSRGFRESYRSLNLGKLIFDSEWCRISIIWGGWDYGGGNSISIRYGRLHAPDNKVKMTWNGEECHCWHDLDFALHFLDGRTSVDAARLNYSNPITDPFYEEHVRVQFKRCQAEWLAQMHMAIWQHYGLRLFELFDLRRPSIWQQYRQFLNDVYDLTGRIPEIEPPLDKVC